MRNILVLLVAASVSLGVAKAEVSESYYRFMLFNHCGPIPVMVMGLSKDAEGIGLSQDSLQTALESRLRSARLYKPISSMDDVLNPHLTLRVGVLNHAFSIDLSYVKWVCHPDTDECGTTPTWSSTAFGTHSGDGGYIRSAVSEKIDQFLVEYLRVNEESCGSVPTTSESEPSIALKIMQGDPDVDYGEILDNWDSFPDAEPE